MLDGMLKNEFMHFQIEFVMSPSSFYYWSSITINVNKLSKYVGKKYFWDKSSFYYFWEFSSINHKVEIVKIQRKIYTITNYLVLKKEEIQVIEERLSFP
jgi:hypothetical protein